MSIFKRTRVVMLPTEKSNLFIINKEKLSYSTIGGKVHKSDIYQPQHLYIISDDKLKDGDWCYDTHPKAEMKINQWQNSYNKIESLITHCQKIIATTDKSLDFAPFGGQPILILPEPSQGFIKKYCEKGGIDEVMVEYDFIGGVNGQFKTAIPKISSDNTITIKSIKDTWNREEVMEICNKFESDLYKNFPEIASAIETVKKYEDLPKYWKKWFKKNL